MKATTLSLVIAINLAVLPFAKADVFTNVGSLSNARYYHSATLLQNGKVLVAGGTGSSGLISSAELYDPANGTWAPTARLANVRNNHTATLLPNGQVLVAGGNGGANPVAAGFTSSTELYNPATENWHAGNSMTFARYGHTATLLRNGKVLVSGGVTQGNLAVTSELYDSAAGIWTTNGILNTGRYYHTATLLQNGKVLVVGGLGQSTNAGIQDGTKIAELYDPATGTWTATGSTTNGHFSHNATLLPNGKVLVYGGTTNFFANPELYDPVSGTWTSTPPVNVARSGATATLLPNGNLLLAGGANIDYLTSAELYDSVSNTWTLTSSLNIARTSHSATVLPSGLVLFACGIGEGGNVLATAEVYDQTVNPTTGGWSATAGMKNGRTFHITTLLPTGNVLVTGGLSGANPALTELYNPRLKSWTDTGSMQAKRYQHTATLLANGNVLVTGGFDAHTPPDGVLNTCELYDPSTGQWRATGSMHNEHEEHTAMLLPNGKVLIVGFGFGTNAPYYGSEIYDPASGTWTNGFISSERIGSTLTLLTNGKVLIAGGGDVNGYTTATLLYDPATQQWTNSGNINEVRVGHTSTLLPNGMVLLAGGDGRNSRLTSAELYDPTTGQWTFTGSMAHIHQDFQATLLSTGKVLVAGGYSTNGGLNTATAELYDPATGVWSDAGNMITNRRDFSMTYLLDGSVLVAGGTINGIGQGVFFTNSEIFTSGLGFSAAWQPNLISATSSISLGSSVAATGSGFRGISGASSSGGQDSSTDYPVVQLRALESGQTRFLLITNWSTNSFTTVPVTNFPPGYAMVTVFVNGIPGTASIVNIPVPVPTPTILTNAQTLGDGSFQFTFTNSPGALFGVLATTDPTSPRTNWTVLGSTTEIAPGQFQFNDADAANSSQRFYTVKAP